MKIKSFEEYLSTYRKSVEDPESFWSGIAQEFHWRKLWKKTLTWDFNDLNVKWFEGGKLNISENCLDRHVLTHPDRTAIIWESNEPTDIVVKLTYRELYEKVCQSANVLKNHNLKKGDRVCIYMPMVPEAAIAMLACARIGAIHSVVFAGFSANSLADRINDAQCNAIITSDIAYRGNKILEVKQIVDEALEKTHSIKSCIVYQRGEGKVKMMAGRDSWWHEEINKASKECEAEEMDSEDELFILYTSGSGSPKELYSLAGG